MESLSQKIIPCVIHMPIENWKSESLMAQLAVTLSSCLNVEISEILTYFAILSRSCSYLDCKTDFFSLELKGIAPDKEYCSNCQSHAFEESNYCMLCPFFNPDNPKMLKEDCYLLKAFLNKEIGLSDLQQDDNRMFVSYMPVKDHSVFGPTEVLPLPNLFSKVIFDLSDFGDPSALVDIATKRLCELHGLNCPAEYADWYKMFAKIILNMDDWKAGDIDYNQIIKEHIEYSVAMKKRVRNIVKKVRRNAKKEPNVSIAEFGEVSELIDASLSMNISLCLNMEPSSNTNELIAADKNTGTKVEDIHSIEISETMKQEPLNDKTNECASNKILENVAPNQEDSSNSLEHSEKLLPSIYVSILPDADPEDGPGVAPEISKDIYISQITLARRNFIYINHQTLNCIYIEEEFSKIKHALLHESFVCIDVVYHFGVASLLLFLPQSNNYFILSSIPFIANVVKLVQGRVKYLTSDLQMLHAYLRNNNIRISDDIYGMCEFTRIFDDGKEVYCPEQLFLYLSIKEFIPTDSEEINITSVTSSLYKYFEEMISPTVIPDKKLLKRAKNEMLFIASLSFSFPRDSINTINLITYFTNGVFIYNDKIGDLKDVLQINIKDIVLDISFIKWICIRIYQENIFKKYGLRLVYAEKNRIDFDYNTERSDLLIDCLWALILREFERFYPGKTSSLQLLILSNS